MLSKYGIEKKNVLNASLGNKSNAMNDYLYEMESVEDKQPKTTTIKDKTSSKHKINVNLSKIMMTEGKDDSMKKLNFKNMVQNSIFKKIDKN